MTAFRVDIPDGVAGHVWLAHVVRTAVAQALGEGDPPSLRLDAPPDPATLIPDETGAHGKRAARLAKA